tara:strand:+ start:192 stop:581 length:390 start_codon:yes stop_codon:yes gene_type:complete
MTADVIKGPWKKGKQVVVPDQDEALRLQEDMAFADEMTQQIMIQLVHTMNENGFDIDRKSFIQSMAFVIECVKGSIYKEMDLKHPMIPLMDVVSKVTVNSQNQLEGVIDPDILSDISEMIDNDSDPEVS